MIGESKNIFRGTHLGFTEGPHLYKYNGFYYLLVAEGGTGYEHSASMARCTTIDGVYEIDPKTPIITSQYNPELLIQKSGHASIVDTPDGEWYMVHLCARPLGKERMCILGRETSIQAVQWRDGWLSMKYSDNTPEEKVEIPHAYEDGGQLIDFVEDFDDDIWSLHLQSLRIPLGTSASLKKRRGYLRLYGGESMSSHHHQSLLAHRQQHFHFIADTVVEFNPTTFQQMAGLIYYYDNISYYYLHITYDEKQGKTLNLLSSVLGNTTYPIGRGISLGDVTSIYLRLTCYMENAQFSYSLDRKHFFDVGPILDATVLSDDYYAKIGEFRFTGAFIGICCQDLSGQKKYADFDYLKYKELEV
ncbi:family 43 glycosylhydrolase [Clostridium sp.]|uniref:beta-xylosidase family glycoside hydrolase n=1 Tax=Clostridium sp. TaxID=1506 RepID=UPI00262F1E0D|nr:family 43 glycosylhydrolase [uncultured Clostridium sp.]